MFDGRKKNFEIFIGCNFLNVFIVYCFEYRKFNIVLFFCKNKRKKHFILNARSKNMEEIVHNWISWTVHFKFKKNEQFAMIFITRYFS